MSTPWSVLVLQMLEEGTSHEEIIAYFNHPVMNEEYINIVLESQKYARAVRKHSPAPPRKTAPGENTKLRVVWNYAQSIGGLEALKTELETKSRDKLAKELNIGRRVVLNFYRDYFQGYNFHSKLFGKAGSLQKKLRLPTPRRKKIKNVRKLW